MYLQFMLFHNISLSRCNLFYKFTYSDLNWIRNVNIAIQVSPQDKMLVGLYAQQSTIHK